MDQANSFISSMLSTSARSKFEINSTFMRSIIECWNTACNHGDKAPLYKYQIEALMSTWRKADLDCDNVSSGQQKVEPMLIVAPTGSGKSGIIVFLPYVLAVKKVLVLTPSVLITNQIVTEFVGTHCFFDKINMVPTEDRDKLIEKVMEEPKIISNPSDADTMSNLVVVNAQKFGGKSGLSLVHQDKTIVENARKFFKKFDTLIVDEAHHYTAFTWQKIVEEFQRPADGSKKRIVFLTATPYKYEKSGTQRTKKFILGPGKEHRVVFRISRELLTGNTIRPCKFYEARHSGTPDKIFQDLENIFRDQIENENRFVPQAMILIRFKDDAMDLAKDLNLEFNERYMESKLNANLDNYAVAVVSTSKDKKRDLQNFNAGKFKVMITCGIGLEGYDNANVVACVILRKIVTGRMLFEQFLGRCLRLNRQLSGTKQDKTVAVVLSYPEFEQRILWDELFDAPVITEEDIEDEGSKLQWLKAAKIDHQSPTKTVISREEQTIDVETYIACKRRCSDGSTGTQEPGNIKHRYSETQSGFSGFYDGSKNQTNETVVKKFTYPIWSPSRNIKPKVHHISTPNVTTGSKIRWSAAPVTNLTVQGQTSPQNSVVVRTSCQFLE